MWPRIWTWKKKRTNAASGQDRTWTWGLRITSPALLPLGCLLEWGSGFRNISHHWFTFQTDKIYKCTKHCPWVQLHPPVPPPPPPRPHPSSLIFFSPPPKVCTLLQQNCLLPRLALLCLSFYQFYHCFFTILLFFLSVLLFLPCFLPSKVMGKGEKSFNYWQANWTRAKRHFWKVYTTWKASRNVTEKYRGRGLLLTAASWRMPSLQYIRLLREKA